MAEPNSKMAFEPRINMNLKEIEEARLPRDKTPQNQLTQGWRVPMMFMLVLLAALQWMFPFFNLSALSHSEVHLHSTPDHKATKRPNFIFIMTGTFLWIFNLSMMNDFPT